MSQDRSADFISLITTPKLHELGDWKVFGKAGLNVDIEAIPSASTKDRVSIVFGIGIRCN